MKNTLFSILLVLITSTAFADSSAFKSFAGKGLYKAIFIESTDVNEIKEKLSASGFTISEDWRNRNDIVATKDTFTVVISGKKPALLVDNATGTIVSIGRSKPKSIVQVGYEVKVWNGSYNGGIPPAPKNAENLVLTKFDLI